MDIIKTITVQKSSVLVLDDDDRGRVQCPLYLLRIGTKDNIRQTLRTVAGWWRWNDRGWWRVTFSICFSRSTGCRVFFFPSIFSHFVSSVSRLEPRHRRWGENNINAFSSVIHRRSIGRPSTERLRLTTYPFGATLRPYNTIRARSFCRYASLLCRWVGRRGGGLASKLNCTRFTVRRTAVAHRHRYEHPLAGPRQYTVADAVLLYRYIPTTDSEPSRSSRFPMSFFFFFFSFISIMG